MTRLEETPKKTDKRNQTNRSRMELTRLEETPEQTDKR